MKEGLSIDNQIVGNINLKIFGPDRKLKRELDFHNDLTTWAKTQLEHAVLLESWARASSNYSVSPMTAYNGLMGLQSSYMNTGISSIAGGGGGLCLNLLGNVANGMSIHGEEPNWSADEVIGFAYSDAISSPKQGAINVGDSDSDMSGTKTVYSFPSGIATGKVYHLVRGGVAGPFVGRVAKTAAGTARCINPVYRRNGFVNSRSNVFGGVTNNGPTFHNEETKTAYTLQQPNSAIGLTIRRNKWTTPSKKLPYYTRLSDLIAPPPNEGFTWTSVELKFCNDNFMIIAFNGGNSPHMLGRFDFQTMTWTFPTSITGSRTRVPRDYAYTPSTQNEDEVRSPAYSNIISSYDGKYLYVYYAYIRNEADTASDVHGKIKIDTTTWKVIARRNDSYGTIVASAWTIPYHHSPHHPGKLVMMPISDNTDWLRAIIGWAPTQSNNRPLVYFDNFDPEETFVTGIYMPLSTNPNIGDEQKFWEKHAIKPKTITPHIASASPHLANEFNPQYRLLTLKDGSRIPYTPWLMYHMGTLFDKPSDPNRDPWKILWMSWNIFSQFTLSEPLDKLPEDSWRIEYTYEIPNPMWETP